MLKKITWLIIVRLILVTLFLSVGAFILKIDRVFFYALIAGVYLLSILYLVWLLQKSLLKLLVFIQLIIDCLLVSVIVLSTGSIDSIFTLLYMVIILNASVIISPRAGMLATGLISFLYIGQIVVSLNNLIPGHGMHVQNKDMSLIVYTTHVHLITFLLMGILTSILSRKINQMEKQIKEKERTSIMGELAAQIAHEIRNPLTTISGSIELLEEELKSQLDAKNANLMKAIVTESERMSSIFEQFLDFSKLDTLQYEVISIRDLLDEIMILLENIKAAKHIMLHKEYEHITSTFEGDRNRLKQVFWNIIRNALEAMPEKGTLRIYAYEKRNMISVAFTDSGYGIDQSQREHLFKPFRSTKQEGSGLGLVIAHKIVERHGGKIELFSKKGVGTTFIVALPKKRMF